MRKTIDGRRYDTDRAVEIVHYTESIPGDFRYQDYGIFRTSHGNWFIAGEGGAMTRFARPVSSNSWCGGEKVIPLVPETVLELVEGIQDDVDCDRVFDFPEIRVLLSEA